MKKLAKYQKELAVFFELHNDHVQRLMSAVSAAKDINALLRAARYAAARPNQHPFPKGMLDLIVSAAVVDRIARRAKQEGAR